MKMYQRTYREEQNIKLLLDLKYPGGYFYHVEVMDMSLDWMRQLLGGIWRVVHACLKIQIP